MQVTMKCQNDPAYERLFDNLIQEVFGFSFKTWFERQLWNEYYESYAIIDQGSMLANVCIYKTDMLLGGKPFRAHQFGAVATRKSARGKGLSRLLMAHVLAKYPDTPAFLAANPSVIDFYPQFGFCRVQTHKPFISADLDQAPHDIYKLNPDDDRVKNAIKTRRCYSQVLDSINTQSIQMFHLLMDYSDHLFYLPGCGAIVIAEQEDNRLFIADVISSKPVAFEQIKLELPFTGVKQIEFGFCPDWLGIAPEWELVNTDEQPYFILGNWQLPGKFRFPAMSET